MTDKHNGNSAKLPKENTDKNDSGLNKKKPFIITVILFLIGLAFLFGTNVIKLEPSINATGKIISPVNKTTISKEFIVAGETKGVNTGQYVWIAFDNPEYRTCLPRVQVPGNIEFTSTITEKNLKDDLRLSLYVLNEAEHKKWIQWQGTQNSQGVKMPSGRKHLDHANIILK